MLFIKNLYLSKYTFSLIPSSAGTPDYVGVRGGVSNDSEALLMLLHRFCSVPQRPFQRTHLQGRRFFLLLAHIGAAAHW